MLVCSRNTRGLDKVHSQEEIPNNLPRRNSYCIIPGIITNGIMTCGGPATFLSRNTALPPLLKLFGEEKKHTETTGSKSEEIKENKMVKRCPSQEVAMEMLPKWLSEGTLRPNMEEVVNPSFSSIERIHIVRTDYSLHSAKEAAEVLSPTIRSISRFLVITHLNKDPNSPSFFKLVSPKSVPKNNTLNKPDKSCLSLMFEWYNYIKEKFNNSERQNTLLALLLGSMLVATASWKCVLIN